MTWLEMNLNQAKTDKEVIARLFNGLSQWFLDLVPELGLFRGCFFINTSAEFNDPSSKISQYCQYHKQQVRELISKHLSNPSLEIVDTVCVLKEGSITIAYVNNDLSMPKKCIAILEGLYNN